MKKSTLFLAILIVGIVGVSRADWNAKTWVKNKFLSEREAFSFSPGKTMGAVVTKNDGTKVMVSFDCPVTYTECNMYVTWDAK